MIAIEPIKYGESVLPEKMCFVDGADNKNCDIVFIVYLIKTDDKKILVDAGCETMPGFVMENFDGTIKALEKRGYSPDEITDVIITHAHHDHIECVKYFHNAVIHIQADEYENGKKYIPDDFSINLFDDEYVVCKNVKTVKIGGHSKGSSVVEVMIGDKIYVIVGDECYLKECFEKKIPTGSSIDAKASKKFIEKYSDEQYVILLCHDE